MTQQITPDEYRGLAPKRRSGKVVHHNTQMEIVREELQERTERVQSNTCANCDDPFTNKYRVITDDGDFCSQRCIQELTKKTMKYGKANKK